MSYVIIGNSAAGIFAAEAIRRHDKEQPLVMLSDEPYKAYARCLTSYYISGEASEKNMYLRPDNFYEKMGIDFHPNQKVVSIDPDRKQVVTDKGDTYSYGKLLVATGASPTFPDLDNIDQQNVFALRTLDDAKRIAGFAEEGKMAVILGGGLVSLKAAAALRKKGVNVTVLVSSNRVLSQILDEEAAAIVESKLLEELKISVFKEIAPAMIHNFPADFILVGKGVKANTEFLRETGLVNKPGEPLKVNATQETKIPHIYAAGDAALSFDIAQEDYVHNAIWPNAAEQGAAAGTNMAGVKKNHAGSIKMNSAVFGDLSIMTAGITMPKDSGYKVIIESNVNRRYYKKLVLAGDVLVGYILVGDTSRGGVYTGLIKSKTRIKDLKKLAQKPGYLAGPK